jgi:hypothetical protein
MKETMETMTTGKGQKKYHIRIVRRNFQGQTGDDYHATVMRLKDGQELVWMATWKWWLKIKIRRGALDRAFKGFDKRQATLSEVEEFCA